MLCSILIPSRWRFEQLKRSIQSWYDTADDVKNFGVIVRLDEDDEESLPRAGELIALGDNLSIYHGRRRVPGEGINYFWNDITKYAKGTWHQYWSDDITIHGQGWDTLLEEVPTKRHVVNAETHQLGGSHYLNDCGGPAPWIPADALASIGVSEIPEPPDTGIYQALVANNGWQCSFLKGIRIYHDRHADRILPKI